MNNRPKKDLHQMTQAELINNLSQMSVEDMRAILPDFRNYLNNRNKIWNSIRESKPIEDTSLESEATNAILNLQSSQWSKTEIENKILDYFGRIQEQQEMILYEIKQSLQ